MAVAPGPHTRLGPATPGKGPTTNQRWRRRRALHRRWRGPGLGQSRGLQVSSRVSPAGGSLRWARSIRRAACGKPRGETAKSPGSFSGEKLTMFPLVGLYFREVEMIPNERTRWRRHKRPDPLPPISSVSLDGLCDPAGPQVVWRFVKRRATSSVAAITLPTRHPRCR